MGKSMIEIYTDGSAGPTNPGHGGWACILLFNGNKKELSGGIDYATNNQMELRAIHEAIQALKDNAKDHPIKIYSDSQWAINAVKGTWKIKKNLDQVNAIKTTIKERGLEIEWIWVKGHEDNELNNRCDELANGEVAKFGHGIFQK
jgi:ribonuclease HI